MSGLSAAYRCMAGGASPEYVHGGGAGQDGLGWCLALTWTQRPGLAVSSVSGLQ